MSFIVNSADWQFDGLSVAQIEDLIDRALAFVATSTDRSERIWIGDDFHIRPMFDGNCIWDLFAEAAPVRLSGEICQEIAAWLGSASCYLDAENWPVGADDAMVAIGLSPMTENPDVAWAHHLVRSGTATGVFTLGDNTVVPTTSDGSTVEMHFVCDEAGREKFWRATIAFEGDDADSLNRNAFHAYPSLFFADGVLSHLERLGGGYLACRHDIQQAFAILNDAGHWAFTFPPPATTRSEPSGPDPDALPTNQLVEMRFQGLGLTAAPEKPNVRNHKDSREARELVLGKRTFYCEWHIKLEPHRNRIHFHRPVPESNNRVIVAMIDEHLPLPGY